MAGMRIRKLADKSEGERIVVPELQEVELQNGETVLLPTGRNKLVNPTTPGLDHEPWPLAGIQLLEAPDYCELATSFVDAGAAEGWIELENARLVRRPAGPAETPTRAWHVFMHADAITFKTTDGEVRYKVVHQPDKYADDRRPDEKGYLDPLEDVLGDEEPVTKERYAAGETRVDWFYGVQKETQS